MVRGERIDYLSYSASPTKAHGGVPICEVDSKAVLTWTTVRRVLGSISLEHTRLD